MSTGSKYRKEIKGQFEDGRIDVYSVLATFEVTDPGLQHAIKKLLMPGQRGKNTFEKDLVEAIDAIQRAINLNAELEPVPQIGETVLYRGHLFLIDGIHEKLGKTVLHLEGHNPFTTIDADYVHATQPGKAYTTREFGRFQWYYDHSSAAGQIDQTDAGREPAKEKEAATGNAAERPLYRPLDRRPNWTQFHMQTAAFYGQRSKDPNTKVGAIAVGPENEVLEVGYNGLPRGVEDREERLQRPEKYNWTCHAEENLVATAARSRLAGATIYTTHLCCNRCMAQLINAGVKRIVVGDGKTSMEPRLFTVAVTMAKEAGVKLVRESDGSDICEEDGRL